VKFHTLYANLSGFNVTAGAVVEEGALIGFSGNTGTGSGPHLHWEFITPLFKTMTINDSPRRDPMNAICGECGAFVGSGVWKKFQCYNLGAANTSADPFNPSWEIMGGYWQWGRKNMAAPGPAAGDPNAGSNGGWNTTNAANGSWS
ncbi:MAG: M23 family metallopeptidase, partial [Bacteroidota bacterium]